MFIFLSGKKKIKKIEKKIKNKKKEISKDKESLVKISNTNTNIQSS